MISDHVDRPFMIIITGHPGTGKSTLGKELATELRLPFISKDDFKELIFDTLGWSDREWSKKVGVGSYAIQNHIIEQLLSAGQSLIVESCFIPKYDNARFQAWQKKYDVNIVQILCFAQGDILFERFKQRSQQAVRHPGHVDDGNHEEYREKLLQGKSESMQLSGELIEYDTTDLANLPYDETLKQILEIRSPSLSA